ncbi:MAG TPA: SoxR reducing system RseC family protein [Bacteroidales bacterium]|nr:SoxR reducing system RseC family protein [Bacteroidales bacterium]
MKKIEHEGIVDQISDKAIRVKIMSMSACASCHAKGACTVADMEEKEVEVPLAGNYKVGQRVMVTGSTAQGLQAAWWAYILPILLLLLTLFVSFSLTGNEALAGLLALVVLVPYFGLIKLSEKFMKKTFQFTINSINEEVL